MIPAIIEPISVGIIVSLINRYIIGINIFSFCSKNESLCSKNEVWSDSDSEDTSLSCSKTEILSDSEDTSSSLITAVSDDSIYLNHITTHHIMTHY